MTETTGDTATFSLSRQEATLLEAELAREIAHVEDELDELTEAGPMLAQRLEELRRLDARLRRFLDELEPLPDVV